MTREKVSSEKYKSVYKSCESRWTLWESRRIESGEIGRLLKMRVHLINGTIYNNPINKKHRRAVRKSLGLRVADTI